MKAYVNIDETGRIYCTVYEEQYRQPEDIEFEFPDDFDFSVQYEYRIVDGELVHDPLPDPPEMQIAQLKTQLASTDYAVIKVYEAMVTGDELPEEEASRYAEMIVQRREWRSQINELEASLEEGGDADGGTDEVGSDPA